MLWRKEKKTILKKPYNSKKAPLKIPYLSMFFGEVIKNKSEQAENLSISKIFKGAKFVFQGEKSLGKRKEAQDCQITSS